jgi:hypothetical protein
MAYRGHFSPGGKVRLTKDTVKLAATLAADRPAIGSVHPADVARIVLLMRRARRSGLARDPWGAPGEGQEDEERGNSALPVHRFLRTAPE